jgi:hypothetical protein
MGDRIGSAKRPNPVCCYPAAVAKRERGRFALARVEGGLVVRKLLMALCVAVVGLVFVVVALASQRRPMVRSFSVSPARFTVGTAGAKLRFRLSKPATVTIAIDRRLAGRLSGHRCVKLTDRLAHRRACTRHVLIGTLVFARQRAGRQTHAFRGRLRGRALAAGRYRATLTAVGRSHHRSRPKIALFTVVRSGAPRQPGPSPGPSPLPPGPISGQFPNPSSTGVPAGWSPAQTRSRDLDVNTASAVVHDIRLTAGADLNIDAPNVTVQRVELQGGMINTDKPGVVIEDTTIDRASPESSDGEGAVSYCGYTARRVAIIERNEGFRDGCSTPTHIEDSYVEITPPDSCGDWHGDGLQGYTGGDLYVSNVTIDFRETSGCPGNAPFFFPGGQGNSAAYVNGLLVRGGGYSFRMGTPGSVRGLRVVQGTWPQGWHYGPISIAGDGGSCSKISPWEAKIVTVDSNWRVTKTVRNLACNSG